MSDLDLRIRALVEAARDAGPTAADRARVRGALALRLVPPPSPPSASPPSSPSPPSPPSPAGAMAGAGAKLVAVGAVIGVTAFGSGVLVGSRRPATELARHGIDVHAMTSTRAAVRWVERPESAAPAPLPSAPPRPEPLAAAAPDARPLLPRVTARSPDHEGAPAAATPPAVPAPAPPAVETAAPALETSSLLEETELLRKAQLSLGAGDARAALARLDELGARHPDGLLREERLAARIVALCAAGRSAEARRDAGRFLAEAPRSIHAARVRASCSAVTTGAGGGDGGR